jgi:predicted phosphodiesterase
VIKERVLALYDMHFPKNIPLGTFNHFAKDFRPTILILGGDMWDLDCISHWNDANFKNIGFDNVREHLQKEAVELREVLGGFRASWKRALIYYIVGNHEDWIRGFASKYPQMEDLSLGSLLEVTKLGIKLVPFEAGKDTLKIGKLYFRHGHQYGSDNPAKQAVMRSKKSVVFGHHHGRIEWSDYSDVDSTETHVGILVPCYRRRDPEYGQGKPNKWMTGFFTACVAESGNFSHHVQLVRASDGAFISQMGRVYNGRS